MADYAESIAGCLYVSSVSGDAGVHPADTNRVRAIIVYDRIWIVYCTIGGGSGLVRGIGVQ